MNKLKRMLIKAIIVIDHAMDKPSTYDQVNMVRLGAAVFTLAGFAFIAEGTGALDDILSALDE